MLSQEILRCELTNGSCVLYILLIFKENVIPTTRNTDVSNLGNKDETFPYKCYHSPQLFISRPCTFPCDTQSPNKIDKVNHALPTITRVFITAVAFVLLELRPGINFFQGPYKMQICLHCLFFHFSIIQPNY